MRKKKTNSIPKIYNIPNDVEDGRIKTATILGFIPIFSLFGIHDFIVKRYAEGIAHALLSIVMLIVSPFAIFMAAISADAGPNMASYVFLYTPFIILFFSYVWAIVESIKFLYVIKQRIEHRPMPTALKEKIKRRNSDWILVSIVVAIVILTPIIIFFIAAL